MIKRKQELATKMQNGLYTNHSRTAELSLKTLCKRNYLKNGSQICYLSTQRRSALVTSLNGSGPGPDQKFGPITKVLNFSAPAFIGKIWLRPQ